MARFLFLKERLDKQTLQRLYHQSGLSYVEIGERFGTRSANVIKLMDEYRIPRRTRSPRKRFPGIAS